MRARTSTPPSSHRAVRAVHHSCELPVVAPGAEPCALRISCDVDLRRFLLQRSPATSNHLKRFVVEKRRPQSFADSCMLAASSIGKQVLRLALARHNVSTSLVNRRALRHWQTNWRSRHCWAPHPQIPHRHGRGLCTTVVSATGMTVLELLQHSMLHARYQLAVAVHSCADCYVPLTA